MVPRKLETVAVIGNGIIGHGIAQVFAVAGQRIRLIGRNEASLGRAVAKIRQSLAQFTRHGLVTEPAAEAAMARVHVSTRLEDAAEAQLVIEAVTEDLALKHSIFESLDRLCAPPAVLASSSGQPASALVARVQHRDRVLAAHFWYPPQFIPLVEVCAGPETAPDIVPFVCSALKAAGKEPVVIDKEIKGFIGNRLQFALLREAWSLWADGVASAEAIDSIARNSFGRRIGVTGPIESADIGGLDTMYAFARFLQPDLNVARDPPKRIGDMVGQGARGLTNGRGIHDWSKRDGAALVQARMDELFRWLKATKS